METPIPEEVGTVRVTEGEVPVDPQRLADLADLDHLARGRQEVTILDTMNRPR